MSSNAAQSRKRTRVDDGDGTPNLQKDEEVWLADGNVVVAADKVAFRVHKSILSLRSEVFRDLFSLPNADAAMAETMDGCPVVHVSDSLDDIRRLFLVLCCGKNYYYDGDTLIAVPFAVLASLIRMGHKYAIQDILDHALSRLRKYYTNTLDEWENFVSRARYVTTTADDAPTVVELARLTDTPSLLPTAFLGCLRLTTRYRKKRDGSLESGLASLPVLDQIRVTARGFIASVGAARSPSGTLMRRK